MRKGSYQRVSSNGGMKLRLEAKRHVELWIYSFADMYMILVFFFIAMAAMYAKKAETVDESVAEKIPSVGRGIASAESTFSIKFDIGSHNLTENSTKDLQDFLPLIKNNRHVMIEVEGYADRLPITSKLPYSSNLDLSNQRAVSVSEWLLTNGIRPHQIRTYSYGSGHTWGKEQQGNDNDRRVVVKLYSKKRTKQ